MTTTYTITLDSADDGSFSADLSAAALKAEWRLGMTEPFAAIAAIATAEILLQNPARALSPEVTAGLSSGTPLRIQADDGSTVHTLFTGFITRVEPLPGDQGARTAVVYAAGPETALHMTAVRLPPQVARRADETIASLLAAVPLRRTPLAGCWVLGVADHSELGEQTTLPGDPLIALETGITTCAYLGDTWEDGIPAIAAIRQLAESERGRFFTDRAGRLVFYSRHHTLLDTTPAAAFSDEMDDLTYTYGADMANHVAITLTPRHIGGAGSTLWMLENPQRIQPGESGFRQITARYRAALDQPCGALAVTPPLSGMDYTANTAADGSGADITADLDVLLVRADFSAALLEVRNRSTGVAYLQAGATLRGTPLLQGDPVTVTEQDATSITFHGLHPLVFDLPALDSVEDAGQLARFELARRKHPRGTAHSLTLVSPRHRASILGRTLFDRITVTEMQTGHHADYFIIGEAHTLDLGAARHRVTWALEPAAGDFWVLGDGLLDQATVLAY